MKPDKKYFIHYDKHINRYFVYLAICTHSIISFKTKEEAKKYIKQKEN